jgi:hypothetical protein
MITLDWANAEPASNAISIKMKADFATAETHTWDRPHVQSLGRRRMYRPLLQGHHPIGFLLQVPYQRDFVITRKRIPD